MPQCVLSLNFKEAFGRNSHKYLFTILQSYGFSDTFEDHIKRM